MALSEKFSNAVTYVLMAYLAYKVFIQHIENPKGDHLSVNEQREITEAGPLLNTTGKLIETGWSKKYLREYNAEEIYPVWFGLNVFKRLRVKEFEYYSFVFGEKIVQVTIGDLSYAFSVLVSVYDFETKEYHSYQEKMIAGIDRDRYPSMSPDPFKCADSGYSFVKGKFDVNLNQKTLESPQVCRTTMSLKIGEDLLLYTLHDRSLEEEDHYDVISLQENRRYFFYNLKSYDNKANGFLKLKGKKINFKDEETYSMTDVGRGVFLYKSNWVWATAVGKASNGERVSINFGGGATTHIESIEDYFKYRGKVYKVDPVTIKYDPLNLMNGMTMKTNATFVDSELHSDVTFTPHHVVENSENLILVNAKIKYVHGTYSGFFTHPEVGMVKFEDIKGMIEFALFKW